MAGVLCVACDLRSISQEYWLKRAGGKVLERLISKFWSLFKFLYWERAQKTEEQEDAAEFMDCILNRLEREREHVDPE
jgi:hypothetical protein